LLQGDFSHFGLAAANRGTQQHAGLIGALGQNGL